MQLPDVCEPRGTSCRQVQEQGALNQPKAEPEILHSLLLHSRQCQLTWTGGKQNAGDSRRRGSCGSPVTAALRALRSELAPSAAVCGASRRLRGAADAQTELEGAARLAVPRGLVLASVYGLWPLLSSRRSSCGQLLLKSGGNVSTLFAYAEKHPAALSVLNTRESGIGCAKPEGSRGREMLGFETQGPLKLSFQPFSLQT